MASLSNHGRWTMSDFERCRDCNATDDLGGDGRCVVCGDIYWGRVEAMVRAIVSSGILDVEDQLIVDHAEALIEEIDMRRAGG